MKIDFFEAVIGFVMVAMVIAMLAAIFPSVQESMVDIEIKKRCVSDVRYCNVFTINMNSSHQ